jgi:serine phosphatase RsbU (regulator of sigma subunit)
LGISFLNDIVNEYVKSNTEIKAAEILNALRIKVISTLSRQEEETAQDGMDISIVVIDKENMIMNFAGANNPAYLARNGLLNKIEADRMPVGYNKKLNRIGFKNKFVKIKMDDSVYIFTDGYADQFGGTHNKKFNVRRFKELLIHLQKFPINEQQFVAEKILMKWQKDQMQIDDILLIGIQI